MNHGRFYDTRHRFALAGFLLPKTPSPFQGEGWGEVILYAGNYRNTPRLHHKYTRVLKNRLGKEGSEVVTKCNQLNLAALRVGGFFIVGNITIFFLLLNFMESVIITPRDEAQLNDLKKFIATSHMEAKVLTDEEKEDLGLLMLMSEADMSDLVPEEEIMKILAQ